MRVCRAFQWHWFTARKKEETKAWQEGGCVPPEAPNGYRSRKAPFCYTGATNSLDRLRVAACVRHVSFSTSISPSRGFRSERPKNMNTVALGREFAVRSVAGRCNCCDEASGGHALPSGLRSGGLRSVLFCATTTKFIKPTRDGAQIGTCANPTGMLSDPLIACMKN